MTGLEIYEHASWAVRGYTQATYGFEQVPVLDVRGMTGEIVVARPSASRDPTSPE